MILLHSLITLLQHYTLRNSFAARFTVLKKFFTDNISALCCQMRFHQFEGCNELTELAPVQVIMDEIIVSYLVQDNVHLACIHFLVQVAFCFALFSHKGNYLPSSYIIGRVIYIVSLYSLSNILFNNRVTVYTFVSYKTVIC